MNDTLGVILGGGAGSRLFPLTMNRSKPAVPLLGKYRLIDIPISNCINSGINRIFVLTQFNSASLNRHISRTYQFDKFRQGFTTVLAAEQTPDSFDWYLGTADAVRQNLPHIDIYKHSHVLILAGDQLYLMDYRHMLARHTSSGADITIGTVPVTAEEAPAFGILKTDQDGFITEFYEKPGLDDLDGKESPVSAEMERKGRRYLASMGIYIFSKQAIDALLEEFPDAHDFGHHLIPLAISRRKVASFHFTGYWSDIGTIRSFYEAHLMLARKGPDFNVYDPQMPLYTNARMLPPAKIQSSYIQDSIIGEASIIVNSHISNSVIGIRSFIGENTTVKNSIIMGSGYYPWHDHDRDDRVVGPSNPGIGEETYIEGAIIDRNASIGRRCILSNRDGISEGEGPGFYIREGLIIVPKNGRIEDFTII